MFSRLRRTLILAGTASCLGLTAGLLTGAESGSAWASAWVPGAGYRSAELGVPTAGRTGFTLMAPAGTGLAFTNVLLPEPEAQNHNLLNGSGLALGDYDADGWCDVFLCNLNGTSSLYRNRGGWRFEDVTALAGLANTNWLARGAAFADVDGDGDLDLLVTHSGKGTRMFWNDGRGRFRDAGAAELAAQTGSTSLALGDLDGDRDLDLYVANYGENTIRSGMRFSTRTVGGRVEVTGRQRNRLKILGTSLVEYGEPHAVYRNNGHGQFQAVSWTDGTFRLESGAPLASALWDLGLTVSIRDLNQDGFPDIYVCNDFQTPDRFWLNDGAGRLQLVAREALRCACFFSMTADFADFNGDGRVDFFVTDMLSPVHSLRVTQLNPSIPPMEHTLEPDAERPQIRRNVLFLNRGDDTYAEIANYAGVAASDWSWCAAFLDVDLDGYEDLLVGNGHCYDTQDLDGIERIRNMSAEQKREGRVVLDACPVLQTPNYAFRNRGDLTFEEVGKVWGFDSRQVSQSLALADLDNDGDLDLVVNCLKTPALVYRNDSSRLRVAVRLKGVPPNTQGIGASIRLLGGAVPIQSREMTCGGRYLASDQPVRVFAAGSTTNEMTLEVNWRSGTQSTIRNVRANRVYEVDEAGAVAPAPAKAAAGPRPTFFQDTSAALSHRHGEEPFDDFKRQPSLPRRFSQAGPGVAWCDLDGDGHDDLVIGSGRGGRLGVYRNEGGGRFTASGGVWTNTLPDDTAGIVGWGRGNRGAALWVGLGNYESGGTNSPSVIRFELKGAEVSPGPSLPAMTSSPGPLALGDIDGDGDPDLFVGGRVMAGRYPEAAASKLYRNDAGQFTAELALNRKFERVGLVNGAVFSDLDGDGKPELVLACEWGPLRLFRFDGVDVREMTVESGLGGYLGLWQSVATGDFDGDGRLDLVAGNWGLNSAYQQMPPGPWHLYWGDFNGDGEVHALEAYLDAALQEVVPWRDMTVVEQDLPWVRERFLTHKAYSQASVSNILSDRLTRARELKVNTLASMLFLNRGDRFEARPLPVEAQWSPAMGLAVGDLDGDGHEDVFLSQNFFAVRKEDPRLDGGRGLWLKGDGQGGFEAVPGQESGIMIYGEQRACAVADYDEDGRTDLVVTQNRGETKLYRNVGGRVGLRVRLSGPPDNAAGVGGALRLQFGGRQGPIREVRAGGGYWSQDSAVPVLAMPEPATGIWVRWPGGSTNVFQLPQGAAEIVLSRNGVEVVTSSRPVSSR